MSLKSIYSRLYSVIRPQEREVRPRDLYSLVIEQKAGRPLDQSIQAIVAASDNQLQVQTATYSKNLVRFKPTSLEASQNPPVPQEIFQKAGLTLQQEIKPGGAGSESGKYSTYQVADAEGNVFKVLFAGGIFGNVGLSREKELAGQIEVAITAKDYNLPFLKALIDEGAFSIQNPPVEIKHTEGKAERRSMFTHKIDDVGQQIADFILVLQSGEELCISFKNEKGDTFSNNGIGGLFKELPSGKIVVDQSSEYFDKLKQFGVNFKLLLKGLNAYATKTSTPLKIISPVTDTDDKHILHYIRAAFGYGYWYVRETAPDIFDIKDFTTKKHLGDYVHKVSVDAIRYPFYLTDTKSSKQCTVEVSFTSKGSTEEVNLRGEIRHTHGGVAPKEMKFKFA